MALIHRRLAVSVSVQSSSLSCSGWVGFLFGFRGTRAIPGWVLVVATERKETQLVLMGNLTKRVIALNSVQENKFCN